MLRRTKIICTIGPAVSGREKIYQLAENGMNITRLNFSHGDHADFKRVLTDLRWAGEQLRRPIGILADIQGPKIRVGKLKGGSIEIKSGDTVFVTAEPILGGLVGSEIVIPTIYKDFVKDISPGNTILLDDGLMQIKCVNKDKKRLECTVIDGGLLKDGKGINVPEASFSALAITEKDYEDILFCVDNDVDFIALSFVRTAQEVRHLKSFLESRKTSIQVISKIEKQDALENLDEIIDASDGILIARGDLAVEVGNERVPVIQKKIVRKCNLRAKPVIIATQMLMSMVENPRPSRAEASDVANATVDQTDAVMLSNETAVGKYPMESVRMMDRIVVEMEEVPTPQPVLYNEWQLKPSDELAIALLQSAVRLAAIVKAKLIVVMTQSGNAARLISKCRPQCRVIALTSRRSTYHQMTLNWGVEPYWMEDMDKLLPQTTVFESIGEYLQSLNLCGHGDRIVISAGLPKLAHGSTNTVKVHQI